MEFFFFFSMLVQNKKRRIRRSGSGWIRNNVSNILKDGRCLGVVRLRGGFMTLWESFTDMSAAG